MSPAAWTRSSGGSRTAGSRCSGTFSWTSISTSSRLARSTIETGKTAHQVAAIRTSAGAAGTVVCNLGPGGGQLHTLGFTGNDGEAYELRKGLAAWAAARTAPQFSRADDAHLLQTPRPQRRDLAGEHERYDTKNRQPTRRPWTRIVQSLDGLLPQLDAVIVLDQVEEEEEDCGVVTAGQDAAGRIGRPVPR